MSQPQESSVHRYFPPADSFVEVRQLSAESQVVDAPHGLDARGYRHFVIRTCMPQFAEELAQELATLFPEDPGAAEELLYELCVEVNPALEIHSVNLRTPRPRIQSRPTPQSQTPPSLDTLKSLSLASRHLERRLKSRVHGQDQAVERLAVAVERAAAGLSSEGRPLGSFLLVGRTGTGKTELVRQLAHCLALGRPNASTERENLIRIDCSEYALAHEYSKLIGSPPGYIGHEEGGQLTRALAERPGAVVLFDEVEKAHPRLHNLLLQLLEEGCMTDGRGQRISLERNFVLMTSNAGAEEIQGRTGSVGFHRESELGRSTLLDITRRALENQFSPEFLGRIDEVLLFSELDTSSAQAIAQDQLTDLAIRARRRGARVAFTTAVARWVAERGFCPKSGARELRNVIRREIEPHLARLLLDAQLPEDGLLRVRVKAGELRYELEA